MLDSYYHYSLAYTVLQIGKLHDSPCMNGNENLSIKFIEALIDQNHEKYEEFRKLQEKLEKFYNDHIKCPRNKIIAHNDRPT